MIKKNNLIFLIPVVMFLIQILFIEINPYNYYVPNEENLNLLYVSYIALILAISLIYFFPKTIFPAIKRNIYEYELNFLGFLTYGIVVLFHMIIATVLLVVFIKLGGSFQSIRDYYFNSDDSVFQAYPKTLFLTLAFSKFYLFFLLYNFLLFRKYGKMFFVLLFSLVYYALMTGSRIFFYEMLAFLIFFIVYLNKFNKNIFKAFILLVLLLAVVVFTRTPDGFFKFLYHYMIGSAFLYDQIMADINVNEINYSVFFAGFNWMLNGTLKLIDQSEFTSFALFGPIIDYGRFLSSDVISNAFVTGVLFSVVDYGFISPLFLFIFVSIMFFLASRQKEHMSYVFFVYVIFYFLFSFTRTNVFFYPEFSLMIFVFFFKFFFIRKIRFN
jgi:hypothetical protein